MSASAGKAIPRLRGDYDNSATYLIYDVVHYGVSSYILKVAESTGNLPTNTTYWQVFAEGISSISPEELGVGCGISSNSGSARTATLADYVLTPNGIVAVTFGADVPANATLNINSQGAKPIYYRGSAIVANVIKAGDTVTFGYNGSQYNVLCIDGGAGHKIINSAGTELTQRDGLQFTDGLEATDDAQGAKTKVGMNLPIISLEDWNAMTEQEKTAYKSAHYRFGIELPDTEGVINAEYMTKLWENPNTTQAFASQPITLSSADYDYLLWIYTNGSIFSIILQQSEIIIKGANAGMSYPITTGDTTLGIYNRSAVRNSDTSYTVNDCYIQSSGSTRTVNNSLLIPVAVYGIKASFQFKVNAIADTLSTRADHCFLDDEVTTVEDAFEWKQAYTDTTSGTITVSQDFREVMVDVGNTSGTNAVRFSFMFPKGFVTRKRAGYYATNTNFGHADVIYDGNSTFTVTYFSGGLQITTYTNVYYR